MRSQRLSDWILWGLSLLIVVQVVLFVASRRASPTLATAPPAAFVVPGDSLANVTVFLSDERSEPLGNLCKRVTTPAILKSVANKPGIGAEVG